MNYLSLMAGEVIGKVGVAVAKEFIHAVTPDKGQGFFDVFQKNVNDKKLNLDDMNIDPAERSAIMEMRDVAMQNNQSKFEIEIHGKRFEMNTQTLNLVPLIS